MTSNTTNRFSPEVRQRAVRMVFDHQAEHASQWATIMSIAPKIGCNPETLRSWVRHAERDQSKRPGLTTDAREPPPGRARPGGCRLGDFSLSRDGAEDRLLVHSRQPVRFDLGDGLAMLEERDTRPLQPTAFLVKEPFTAAVF